MFQSNDPQALEVCPYNSAHRILKYRMAKHIAKCKKQYEQSMDMSECPFNATHRVPTNQLQYHLQNCPDRFNLDKSVFLPANVDQQRFPIPQLSVECEENWDDDRPVEAYDPKEYCEKNAILRQVKVESLATRKYFRMEERTRIQKLKDMEPLNTSPKPRDLPKKFRTQSLANTITNVDEPDPYAQEISKQIVQKGNVERDCELAGSDTIKNVDEPDPCAQEISKQIVQKGNVERDSELAGSRSLPSSSSSSEQNTDVVKQQDADGFILKSRRKIKLGKGRGRGVLNLP